MPRPYSELMQEQASLCAEARRLVRSWKLIDLFENVGEAHLVGSVALRLVVKRDIDFHVLVPELEEVEVALNLARDLLEKVGVRRLEVMRFLWRHAAKLGFDTGRGEKAWHVDVWVTSEPDQMGHREVRRLKRILTPKHRETILRLKTFYNRRDMCRYGLSYEIYRGVTEGGVRSPREFMEWARKTELSYIDTLEMLEADDKQRRRKRQRGARRKRLTS